LSALSVKQLQNILRERNVDFSGCIEKADLINAVLTSELLKVTGEVTVKQKEYGALVCTVVERSGSTPQCAVVLCHGLGANAEDLAPLGTDFLNRNKQAEVTFLIPNAPTIMDHGGRAWWPLNLQDLMNKALSGQLAQIINDSPPGLETARNCLQATIFEFQAEKNIPWNKFIIGGFSQGAIISTDLLLHLPHDFGGLVLFSGSYICAKEWTELAKVRINKKTKVLQSHGKQDFILPFVLATYLRQFLTQFFDVDFVEFNGGHTIPASALDKFSKMVLELTKIEK